MCGTHILTIHSAACLSTIHTHSETYLAQGFVTSQDPCCQCLASAKPRLRNSAHLLPQQPVGYVARLMYAGALNHNSLWKYVHVTDGCRCSES